ncbi:hypothetical protein [Brevibacillus centrosporus]|jgi:hypothetical protein|uniref:N-acetyltransferase domain-containing protein n=1 Tax=Brevibacillus centrosporus TaxID=54910 RepID=A0A1I4BPE2_9BACL|nr:hypothetical protein [Brevibacillus centrosporus]MEC2132780.1 hypothetical protein [Brevibacillus centrosporus]RNB66579.1 hypothetical protein EDM55_22940 [Brevibacillus centrosporus]GED33053.1 hypothetical protein BCE02nite_41940 [Brevibacillus centrosporus]SFK70688.1 hypothetical protein SAMN05518846_11832 [Brevibacillus centrosporus]
MSYDFSVCATEFYMQNYLEFLLENYSKLNLPYSFPVTLSYIASPAFMEQIAILCYSDDHEMIGTIGCILGTGENDYQDTHIAQIQVIHFLEPFRRTLLFLRTMQFFTQHLAQLPVDIRELRFWAPSDDYLRPLFSKLAKQTAVVETDHGGTLIEYRASFSDWHSYAAKFRHDQYYD